jgi:hypothetical protein
MPILKKPKKNTVIVANKEYGDFIQSLDVRALGLKDSSSMLDRSAFFQLSNKGARPIHQWKQDYRLVRIGKDFFDADGHFELTVTAKEADKPALVVQCTFTAHIHAAEPISKEFAKRFTESELWIVMLPYGRYFITDITTRMAIPPIVIPLGARRSKP